MCNVCIIGILFLTLLDLDSILLSYNEHANSTGLGFTCEIEYLKSIGYYFMRFISLFLLY